MATIRNEHDGLGEMSISADVLYGIHTQRAMENFTLAGRPVRGSLIHAYGAVKLAALRTNRELNKIEPAKADAIESACLEMIAGELDNHIVVDALQGGAGTSTNMNVNEVLANRALQLMGKLPGDVQVISPSDHVNLHQSTNDTFPTAGKVAIIGQLKELETKIVALQEAFQLQEKRTADVVKIGRTQLQDAVLTTLGREMAAYAEAIARDRWRIYKSIERLRVVNLGGTAIGTGLAAPRDYIFRVVDHLREITQLPLARAENLIDATQNTDLFVEVSGLLKTCASNLLKIATDLRLLASGPAGGLGEISLPARQAGSSIMPGKVNPVIPEAVTQAALVVLANDQAITQACAMGNLELNPFLPLIVDKLLENLELLDRACDIFRRHGVEGIEPNRKRCRALLENNTATVTALVGRLGYRQGEKIIAHMSEHGQTVRETVLALGLLTDQEYEELISPEAVMRLGWPEQNGETMPEDRP